MMWKRSMMLVLGIVAAQRVAAQAAPPNAMVLAQAQDRCMTTYAVRMTKTDATDEEIYSGATEGCKDLQGQLHAAIAKEYSADQAKELIATLEAQAKPNFLQLLQKIRADRQIRAAN